MAMCVYIHKTDSNMIIALGLSVWSWLTMVTHVKRVNALKTQTLLVNRTSAVCGAAACISTFWSFLIGLWGLFLSISKCQFYSFPHRYGRVNSVPINHRTFWITQQAGEVSYFSHSSLDESQWAASLCPGSVSEKAENKEHVEGFITRWLHI